jgi:tryptophan synthase alpha chain
MRRANFSGMIIPDLVPEEGAEMERLCRENEIDLIYLLAPTSNKARRSQIIRRSRGFVYLVSVAGVTGARNKLPQSLFNWIRKVKRESNQPVCVGFGISNGQQARAISKTADGIIVGSALVEIINRASNTKQMIKNVESFVTRLRKNVVKNDS